MGIGLPSCHSDSESQPLALPVTVPQQWHNQLETTASYRQLVLRQSLPVPVDVPLPLPVVVPVPLAVTRSLRRNFNLKFKFTARGKSKFNLNFKLNINLKGGP